MLYFQKFCEQLGISSSLSVTIAISVSIILLILVSWIAYVLTWKIMRRTILPIIQRSKTTFDDILVKHRFFKRLAFFVPAILLYYFLDDAIGDAYKVPAIILDFIDVWLVIISIMIIESVLSTIRDYYQRYEISKERPIDSFVQVIKIIHRWWFSSH